MLGTHPLPPSAALPLCKGENTLSPLQRGTAAAKREPDRRKHQLKRQGVAHTGIFRLGNSSVNRRFYSSS